MQHFEGYKHLYTILMIHIDFNITAERQAIFLYPNHCTFHTWIHRMEMLYAEDLRLQVTYVKQLQEEGREVDQTKEVL